LQSSSYQAIVTLFLNLTFLNLARYTSIIFLAVSILLGFVLTSQVLYSKYLSTNPFEPYQDLQDSIRSLSQEQKTLQTRLDLLRNEVSTYESEELNSSLKNNLQKLKEQIGLTEISGNGIKVTLDDKVGGEGSIENVCYAADLRDIVNLMRVANVKGIAINDQRVTYATSIACVGDSVLLNNVRMLPPFEIMAVTSRSAELENYLTTEKFLADLYDRLAREEVIFVIEKRREILLPAYKGNLAFDYLKSTADEI
jgi:uncharacterized protein YlxW (UPF0749 family)